MRYLILEFVDSGKEQGLHPCALEIATRFGVWLGGKDLKTE